MQGMSSASLCSHTKVFVSYSHDSEEHRERALGLAQRLRADGFDTMIDRYVEGTPADGWPRWMLDQIERADYILIVCTQTYYLRFRGQEAPGVGKGVDWEGAIITNELYDQKSISRRFVPILFDSKDRAYIPEPLRGFTHYLLTNGRDYTDLTDYLANVAGIQPGKLGPPPLRTRKTVPPLKFPETDGTDRSAKDPVPRRFAAVVGSVPPIVMREGFKDRQHEASQILSLLTAGSDVRLVSIIGPPGVGKTALACHVMQNIGDRPGKPTTCIFLSKSEVTFDNLLESLAAALPSEAAERLHETLRNPGISESSKIQVAISQMVNLSAVVLLDNLETETDPNGLLRDRALQSLLESLIRRQHGVKFLATSQGLLEISADLRRMYESIPFEAGLPESDAAEFLQEMDSDRMLGIAALASDNAVVREVVRKTHGFPKALEYIVGLLTKDRLLTLEKLASDKDLLEGEVQAKLVAAANQRLKAAGQRVMEAVAIFDQPIRLEVVEFLLAGVPGELDIRATINQLAIGRFLSVDRSTQMVTAHSLNRVYYLRKLAEGDSPTIAALHRRAAEWFRKTSPASNEAQSFEDIQPRLSEVEHLIAAQDYEAAAAALNAIDPVPLSTWGHHKTSIAIRTRLAARLTGAGNITLNAALLAIALVRDGRYDQALRELDAVGIRIPEADERTRAFVLTAKGQAMHFLGRNAEAARELSAGWEHWKHLHCEREQTDTIFFLGKSLYKLCRYGEAWARFKEAQNLEAGPRFRQTALLGQGYIHLDRGDFNNMEATCEEAYKLARETGNVFAAAEAGAYYALALSYQGDYDRAAEELKQVLDQARKLGRNQWPEAFALGSLANNSMAAGKFAEAVQPAMDSRDMFRELCHPPGIQFMETIIAQLALHNDRFSEAREIANAALKNNDVIWNNFYICLLSAIASHRIGDRTTAVVTYERTLEHCQEANWNEYYRARHIAAVASVGLALMDGERRLSASPRSHLQVALSLSRARGVCDRTLSLVGLIDPNCSSPVVQDATALIKNS